MAGILPFGGSGVAPIDISQQLSLAQKNAQQNQGISSNLYNQLQPMTTDYQKNAGTLLTGAGNTARTDATAFQGQVAQNTQQAQDALRKNLYSNTFSALPGTLEATREASAAGGGVNSGAYNKAVAQIGQGTAQTIAQGEAGIQAQGAQAKTAAATQAYSTVQNIVSKLNDQQLGVLQTAFQSGRSDLIQNASTQMGLNDQETQALIQLLNFQQSSNMAAQAGEAANNQAALSGILGAGTKLGATYMAQP